MFQRPGEPDAFSAGLEALALRQPGWLTPQLSDRLSAIARPLACVQPFHMRPPGGNVTLLFTDIERSTQLWEKNPQAMGRALAQHDALLRAVAGRHNGYVFKTVGDAFCIAFEGAMDAVRAAVAAQRDLAAANWPDTASIRVRMAIHSGEVEQRDGDYFGLTLNRVARLLAAGHGGQTLLSRVTAEMVREHLPDDASLRDFGDRRLKDLSRPERIFQMVVHDLPADFPPLRSLEVLPNNLPAQVTSFIGRVREMAELKRLLRTTRLLTLIGPGGTGKTRLSLQAAAEMLEEFPHGVWLVEFATVSDSALVPETIANIVEVREEHGRAPLETLADALRPRHLLLVLDNCEHLISACAQTAATLLRRCPKVTILASSREALNIEGETLQPVPPLGVPEFSRHDNELEPAQIAELEAVKLFIERASAVRPGFSLTPENAPLIARICWRLDGIPLAIELAAARIKVLSLEQIFTRLDDRFRLLSGGSRAALPRQQTLGALIDWSYDLLSEPERILLRRLTVFVAGRTLEMAEEVCAGEGLDTNSILDLLSSLVEKSLLMIEPGPGGETRYTLLESVWDYGDDKLAQHQETARYRGRHLDYFAHLAGKAENGLFGKDQKTWLEKLSAEHYNLNAALHFSAGRPESIGQGLRLAGALARYWEVHSYLTEGYEHFQKLLAGADDSIDPVVRAKAEVGAGRLSWCQDRDADALRHYRSALVIYEEARMMEQIGLVEALLGFAERSNGNSAAGRAHFERAKAIAEGQRSEGVMVMAVNGLASLAADEGNFVHARHEKEQSLVSARTLGDQWVVALVAASLGKVCIGQGDFVAARKFMRQSLAISRDLGNKWVVPYAVELLGDICANENQPRKAVQLYGAASAQREALAMSFSVMERNPYQHALDRLRRLVASQVFESEWQKGRSLDFKASIELAMEDAPTKQR
jgi:predicted ATPase/class 3 adenylate cyclase